MTDFAALRAERNARFVAAMEKIAAEWGVPADELRSNFNPGACYCACPGGPCEHRWDGPWHHTHETSSATCSRCGTTAISHDMRTAE